MTGQISTDEQIAAQVIQVPEMFAFLIDRYEEKLDRYIYRKTHLERDLRQDILQEVFIKAYEHIASFDSRQSFNSWIYRICHNTIINDWKRNKRYREGIAFGTQSGEFLEQLFAEDSLQFVIESEEEVELVKNSLGSLSQKHHDILHLRFYEELSYDEISDVLQIPPGTVATNISRAKKSLHKLLQPLLLN